MKLEITKVGDFKCLIEILEYGTIQLLGAIDGWGNSYVEDVAIEEIKSATEV